MSQPDVPNALLQQLPEEPPKTVLCGQCSQPRDASPGHCPHPCPIGNDGCSAICGGTGELNMYAAYAGLPHKCNAKRPVDLAVERLAVAEARLEQKAAKWLLCDQLHSQIHRELR